MSAAPPEELRPFCPSCFADDQSGSWNHVVVGWHCTNCGNGSTVQLPAWAIAEIRRTASWVGKRYYPHDEDRENAQERAALLQLVTEFPGRTAEPCRGIEDAWTVVQQRAGGGSVSTMVRAPSAEEAMRKVGLPYVPAAALAQGSLL